MHAAAFLSVAILLSKLLGLVQLRLINGKLSENAADAYYAAFRLPDFIMYLVAGGALSVTFIPIFIELKERDAESGQGQEAWSFFSNIATIMGTVLVLLLTLCWILARPLTGLANPGFYSRPDKETLELTIAMTRVLLPAQFFFYLGGMIVGVLNAHKRFGASGLTSAVYNLVAICTGFVLWLALGETGFAWGILIGAFCGNFLLPFCAARNAPVEERLRFWPSFDWRNPALQRFFRNALPIMLGVSLPVVDQIVVGYFASYLPEGDLACLTTGNRVMIAPLSMLAQAASVAAFPFMAQAASGASKADTFPHALQDGPTAALVRQSEQLAKGNWDEFTTFLRTGLRRLVFLSLPVATLLILCAQPIINLFFRTGNWEAADPRQKAAVAFAFYCVGLFAWAGQQFVARGFYALQDTRTPTIIGSVLTIFFFVPLCYIAARWGGVLGLALATSVGAGAHFCGILIALERKLAAAPYNIQLHSTRVLGTLLRTVTACTIMGIAGLVALRVVRGWHPLLQITGITLIAGIAFAYAASAFRIPEWSWILAKFSARLPSRLRRA